MLQNPKQAGAMAGVTTAPILYENLGVDTAVNTVADYIFEGDKQNASYVVSAGFFVGAGVLYVMDNGDLGHYVAPLLVAMGLATLL